MIGKLPEGWREVPLSEVVSKIIDYRGKTPKKLGLDWSKNGKYRALSAKTVKTGGLVNEEQINLGDEELYKKWMKDEVVFNDILLTSEAPMGEVLIWKSDEKIILSQRLFALRVKEKVSADYVYYYLISRRFQGELLARASGTTVVGIKQSELLKTNIFLPHYDEQKAIANILSSFDNKIELLKEQNKTLETMAQTIFKEWFVDFNYPNATGEMIDSEMGKIPKGWRVGKLEEIIEFINGYAFKSKELIKTNDDETYSIFKMGHIKKGGGFNPSKTKDYINKSQCSNLQKYILKEGDLLMCMTDMKDSTSLLGHTALMFENNKYIVNQRVGLIRVKNNLYIDYPWLYILTNSQNFISDLRNRANSGVQINLSTIEIKKSQIIIPDKRTNKLFKDISLSIFEKIKSNFFQVQTLEDTRDKLLPKLISGNIRVFR